MRYWLTLAYSERYRNSMDVVLVWCLWMLAAWLLWAGDGWYHIRRIFSRGDWAGPAVRWMAVAAMLGVCLLWPVVRLGQLHPLDAQHLPTPLRGIPRDRRIRQLVFAMRDWLGLSLVFMFVCWPLWYLGHWQRDQTAWIAAAIASWGLLIGMIVAVGRWSASPLARTAAMVVAVGVTFGEPLLVAGLAALRPDFQAWDFVLSPLQVTYAIGQSHGEGVQWSATEAAPQLYRIVCVASAGVLGWTALFTWAGWRMRARRRKTQQV